jgi:FkbH-like protein
VVQSNFAPPAFRSLGNHEARHESGFARFVSRVNLAMADSAPAYVTIHDLDHLSATWGRWAWDDSRYFHQAKLPCSPEMLVDYAYDLSGIILSLRGQARKCLVLDLDNTLWGGVIGDDGLAGIRLGQGDPEGEAFIAFQKYAKALKERGVILAVCSKNTESVAREVFEKHEEMVLRLGDISCFMANWEDKAGNIKRIAEQLNIGMNSLVFVDDNPAERAIVRDVCPDVAVPEMPEDPAEYVEALDRYRYFETMTISAEDLQRTAFYRASTERETLEASATDMDSFLISLELRAKVVPISAANLERSAQLIGRSNQFNLTTRRYSTADLQAMLKKPDWVTRTISLKDRFGDNGLISVVLANIEQESLRIDTWLMSCRVLKRGVERLQLDDLAEIARARGLSKIVGEYIPTAKNALVVAHYKSLGFEKIGEGPDGRTRWQLDVGPNWQPLPHHIILEQV